jgi:hypothetical protein
VGGNVEFVLDYGPPGTEMDIGTRLHCMCFSCMELYIATAGDSTIYYLRDNKETKRHAHLYFPAVDPIYVLPDWIDLHFRNRTCGS